jgi:hypothetical protein
MRDPWITNMDAFLGKFITFGIVIVVAWSSVSCAKDEDNNNLSHTPPGLERTAESFSKFYERFGTAVENNDWESLARMTKFPFTFRGQLDSEGELKVNKAEFIKIAPGFFAMETTLVVNGEAFTATYRDLAITPTDEIEKITGEYADVQEFAFSRVNGQWLFVKAYADINTISSLRE